MATDRTLEAMWPWRPTRGSRRTDPPARDLPDVQERLLHVTEAHLAGAISDHPPARKKPSEVEVMRNLILHFPSDLPDNSPMLEVRDIDIYRRFSTNPQQPGEWFVWTLHGERPIRWWQRLYGMIVQDDESDRLPW